MNSLRKQDDIHVGAVNGVHGLLGDVKIKSFVVDITVLKKGTVLTDEAGCSYTVQKIKTVGQKKIAFKFAEITDRTAAEKLVGTDLYLAQEKADDVEVFDDIIGLTVKNSAGETVGTVVNIFDNGAHDILEVDLGNSQEALIPYTDTHTITEENHISLTLDGDACLDV